MIRKTAQNIRPSISFREGHITKMINFKNSTLNDIIINN
jgi:hypothetical protein